MVYFSYLSYSTVCHFLALNSQFENLRFPMNFFITAGILTAAWWSSGTQLPESVGVMLDPVGLPPVDWLGCVFQ